MKVAFLTEMGFSGKVPKTHKNMRTEFAWMVHYNADHFNIRKLGEVVGYDKVFIIFPKGRVFLSAEGSKLVDGTNPVSDLLNTDIVSMLKSQNNGEINYIQEGPHWWFNDYSIQDQILFYNFLSNCDTIFAHNQSDVTYYRGLFPDKRIEVMKTMMVDDLVKDITPSPMDKVIIGGNFARWYGGFESYVVAREFGLPIWTQSSHAMRENEELVDGLNHLPRLEWLDWMKQLSTFKYAVHLMPTVAAGTFSLNCAYFGIPCIGNEMVDTQRLCHPHLSVDVNDLERARKLAIRIRDDVDFYNECSDICRKNYEKYYQPLYINK
jgi:hypothetical protein